MATIPDRNLESVDNDAKTTNGDDHKTTQEDEVKKLPTSSSNDSDQGDKTTNKADDLNQITPHTNSLSSEKSSNEDMKSNTISSASNTESNTNTEKKNEEKISTNTPTKEEFRSTPVSSSSANGNAVETTTKTSSNNDEDSKKVESTAKVNSSDSNDNRNQQGDDSFTIGKGDSKYLTDLQRQKAKYFFNVNLDIENKEFVTWEDVEFYLLFHVTAAGKEGSDDGDLEGRLSRATRAFWEHVHDQVPLPDGKRDTLALDQFLDAWASLTDYVVRRNQLPPVVQDLVKLGFELYSTDSNDGELATIEPSAFDQLFQKMNLGRSHAIIAYKFLTQNGTQLLDADKVESIVKGVITSSDEEHNSHFLLPGFFKILGNNKNNEKEKTNKPSSPVADKEQIEVPDKSSTSTSPSQQTEKPQESSSTPIKEQKPNSPSQSNCTSQNGTVKSATENSSTTQQPQQCAPPSNIQKPTVRDQDESIRRLLQYYHIDDGDIVEVADGSAKRVVLLHPERPLPTYIQKNPDLLKNIQQDSNNVLSTQQNGSNVQGNKSNNDEKPKLTLEERVSRGEAQKGPTIPVRQVYPQQGSGSATRIRQVYPQLNEAHQEEQQKQAKIQAAQSHNEEKKTTETSAAVAAATPSSPSSSKEEKPETHRNEEEKLVAAVLKRLVPIVEKKVSEQLRRMQSDGSEQGDDEADFIPFPFMFGGAPFFAPPGRGPPSQLFRQQQQQQQQQQPGSQQNAEDATQEQQPSGPREVDFGRLPPGSAFIPPQLLMAMMNDLARGGMEGEMSDFPGNMPPPPRGPGGVPSGLEGFMMFVDGEQMMGSQPGYSSRAGPRF
ncbi:unnamed protein product [Rotaria socialis]|uniref:Uncharacterized protein n=1 Tax=Rotaria socialis TaxID=392032 RepID=A0A817P6W8_9BILA|nr:unnamed protein product [Rotaria socialis]CAF4187983.1 unnamed protein product [Rotaria socialis]